MLTVQIGQELHGIAAGGLAWGARGTPHAFANRAQEPLRIMILWIPDGAERVFEEMEEYVRTAAGSPEQEVTAAILARYGATRVGPPIAIPNRTTETGIPSTDDDLSPVGNGEHSRSAERRMLGRASTPVPLTGFDTYEVLAGGYFLVHHVDVQVGGAGPLKRWFPRQIVRQHGDLGGHVGGVAGNDHRPERGGAAARSTAAPRTQLSPVSRRVSRRMSRLRRPR
jgi:hypothetical protein